jgi:predicted dehydrogenase
MKAIGCALIGCGKVGATHAQALASLPEARFVAAYDARPESAAAFAARYGVRPYSDLGDLLADREVEAVTICTPHVTHPDLAVACTRAGRHVLVEKPMAVDLKGCDRMIEAAERARVKLGVISQRRFYEPVQRMKAAIEAGKIGRPVLGVLMVFGWRDEGYYRLDPWRGKWATEGGGVMLTQTTHQIDLLQWFMGPIAELFGYWDNLNHPYIEVDDTVAACVRFKNGGLGSIVLSNSQKPGLYAKVHVHGSNGASVGVQIDGGSPLIFGVPQQVFAPINDIWTVPGEEGLLAQWQAEDEARCQVIDVMSHYHKLQIQDFLQAIGQDRDPAVNGREGRKAVEIFTAVYRAQRDGRPVQFPLDAEQGSEDFDGRLVPRRGRG